MAKNKRQQETMTITFKPLTVPTHGFSKEIEAYQQGGRRARQQMQELVDEIAEREGWWPELDTLTLNKSQQSGLQPGDWFDPAGYEQVASIQAAEEIDPFNVVVLHNNSTHLLVAVSDGRGERAEVRLVRSLPYGEDYLRVYSKAIEIAATMAARAE